MSAHHESRAKQREHLIGVQSHYSRVSNAKSTLDTWNVKHIEEQQKQRKNRQFNRAQADRQNEIRRNNEFLVEKITETMLQQNNSPSPYPASGHKTPFHVTSLNYHLQKREHDRIAQENVAIAKRIIFSKPTYEQKDFLAHSDDHDRHLTNLKDKDPTPPIMPRLFPDVEPERQKSFVPLRVEQEEAAKKQKEQAAKPAAPNRSFDFPAKLKPIAQSEAPDSVKSTKRPARLAPHSAPSPASEKQPAKSSPPAPLSSKSPTKSSPLASPKTGAASAASPTSSSSSSSSASSSSAPSSSSTSDSSPQSPDGAVQAPPVAISCAEQSQADIARVHFVSTISKTCLTASGSTLSYADKCDASTSGWTVQPVGEPAEGFVAISLQGSKVYLCSSREGEVYLSHSVEAWGDFSAKWKIAVQANSVEPASAALKACLITAPNGRFLAVVDNKAQTIAEQQLWLTTKSR